MVTQSILDEAIARLIKAYDPLEIYLFGSYAWGHPTEESDLDILIVVESSFEKSYKRPVQGHIALHGLNISKDLIVMTKEEFSARAQDSTTLAHKIKSNGKLVYAKHQ